MGRLGIDVEDLIARAGDDRVARAAYEEAVKQRPGRIVTLRQKTRLADSRGEPDSFRKRINRWTKERAIVLIKYKSMIEGLKTPQRWNGRKVQATLA